MQFGTRSKDAAMSKNGNVKLQGVQYWSYMGREAVVKVLPGLFQDMDLQLCSAHSL